MDLAACRRDLTDRIFCIMFLLIFGNKESMSVSSSSVYACLGEQLRLTCGTNSSALRWNVLPHGTNDVGFTVVVLQLNGGSVSPAERVLNSDVYQTSITSLSPLVSMMLVDNVTANVNGTRVECRDSNGVSTTIVHVIGNALSNPSLMINEIYGAENVEVILEWTVEPLASYNITVTADSYYRDTKMIENSRFNFQLTLSYNSLYRVSFVATHCGHNSTTVFELQYVKCGSPLEIGGDDDSVTVSGYGDPALVGTKVTISCVSRSELTGKSTSVEFNVTCLDNGCWEPDPRQDIQQCYDGGGNQHSSTSSTPICSNDGSWKSNSTDLDTFCTTESSGPGSMFVTLIIAVVFSVIPLIIIFFTIGFVCGCFSHKYKRSTTESDQSKTGTQDLEMMENVAYGPLQLYRNR